MTTAKSPDFMESAPIIPHYFTFCGLLVHHLFSVITRDKDQLSGLLLATPKLASNPAMDLPIAPLTLSAAEAAALAELYRRGTPQNTLRAWERDLAYITAWKAAAFGAPLDWPETEPVALRFILDHAADLRAAHGPARDVAKALIRAGLRRSLTCPGNA